MLILAAAGQGRSAMTGASRSSVDHRVEREPGANRGGRAAAVVEARSCCTPIAGAALFKPNSRRSASSSGACIRATQADRLEPGRRLAWKAAHRLPSRGWKTNQAGRTLIREAGKLAITRSQVLWRSSAAVAGRRSEEMRRDAGRCGEDAQRRRAMPLRRGELVTVKVCEEPVTSWEVLP